MAETREPTELERCLDVVLRKKLTDDLGYVVRDDWLDDRGLIDVSRLPRGVQKRLQPFVPEIEAWMNVFGSSLARFR